MHLTSLEVAGFKSFGKKATLEFTSPISAIVGPNGSGKSNIAESFRFVLGEQSIKSLRGKKGEDLIFNGGKMMARQNRASVKATFDNRQRILNIDFDEVVLERAVNRDGTNEYKINGSDVRLKDIVELLSSAHIGSSGHHIISQGEADRMLNASLRERKTILEEALGLKTYQYKKEEGEKKLQKTELNMKETESLLREIAPHLRFLQKQHEKIQKAEVLRGELIVLSKLYFFNESNYLNDRAKNVQTERLSLEMTLDGLRAKKDELRNSIKNFSVDGIDVHIGPLEDELREINDKKNNCLREIGKIEGEISYIKRSLEKKMSEQKVENDRYIPIADIKELQKQAREAQSLEEIYALVDMLIHKYQTAEIKDDDLLQLKNELLGHELRKKEMSETLFHFESAEESLRKKIQEGRAKIEEGKQGLYQAERELFKLESESKEVENRILHMGQMISIADEEKKIFLTDLEELAMLLGREVLQYESLAGEFVSPDVDRVSQHEKKRSIERLKIRLEEAGISNAGEVIKEYRETEERHTFLRNELNDLETSKNSLLVMIDELSEKIDIEFKIGVQKINEKFNELFRVMFGGGQASLEVVREKIRRKKDDESEDGNSEQYENEEESEGEEGIDIFVELPHKKTKGLVMLSGGERALTSIALLFAMSQVNPPPFIILDETDAALDEANSRKYGDMIETLAAHSELIVITHNRETMSRAGVIYGVTMASEGTSKLLSIKFDEAVVVAK